MRKTLLACLPVLCCGAAHAQSTVTLYGIIDVGLVFNSNAQGHDQYYMNSSNAAGSRWGLLGSEDLGGGTAAIFNLEGGFAASNGTLGQGGTEFGRRAYVGLSNKQYGTVSAGRNSITLYDFMYIFQGGSNMIAAGSGYATHPGDADNMDNFRRANNQVKYVSPTWGGAKFGGSYSFGGVAGDFTQKQIWSLAGSYVFGPLAAAVAYEYVNRPNFATYGNQPADSATGNNFGVSRATSGYATARSQQIFAAGASYTLGNTITSLLYTNARFGGLGEVAVTGLSPQAAAFRGTAVFNSYEVNLQYQLTPALQLAAQYAFTRNGNANGLPSARYNQVDLGADYHLSKRTDVYLYGLYLHAAGVDSTGGRAVAASSNAIASSGSGQIIVLSGIRHTF